MTGPSPSDLVDEADLLRLAVGRLARRLRQHSLGGLTPSQRSALTNLGRLGALSMGELASAERIAAPTMTGIVSRLEERGLVERARDPADRRSTVISLSGEGRDLLEAGRRERTAFLADGIAALDDVDRRKLVDAIQVIDRLAERE